MKFSENWLRTFTDPPLASRALADALTMSGLEVEAIEPVAPAFERVVVAEVTRVQKHPNADRLTVCEVNAGAATLQIVCGAPNVRAGIRVPLALVGANLPAIEIKQTNVRGVESSGMLCSPKDLGIADDASGLMLLAADAPVGADLRRYLDLDDQLFTIKPTPNRGDCLSVFGVAREVAAITGTALTPVAESATVSTHDRIVIVLEDETACSRYCGRIVRGVDASAPTPSWIAQRLERSGMRCISAIVDITNFVMLELGQPMHAFDFARIDGEIHVRFGRNGEKLKLLNEQEIALEANLLVIADREKPLALAGIMGGADSAVGPATQAILLESAFFDPAVIAGKSRQLGFGSDSSYRFERGVDFAATQQAMERTTQLVLEICGGRAGPICEVRAALPARQPVRLRTARAQSLLGIGLSSEEITVILRRLGFAFEVRDGEFVVTPPSYRFDLAIEEDLVEEVARIHGYERIAALPPAAPLAMLPASEKRVSVRALRNLIVARDYQEIISYSFVSRQWESDFCANTDPVTLVNPIAAQFDVMRSSLVGSLVENLALNLSRQQDRVRLFEIGRCFARAGGSYKQTMMVGGIAYGEAVPEQWGVAKRKVDFYDVKSDVEAMVGQHRARFKPVHHPALHPGRAAEITVNGVPVGWLGELHPKLLLNYNLPFAPMAFELDLELILDYVPVRYTGFSRQPYVRRDIAIEVRRDISAQVILDALKEAAPGIVSDVDVFDVYRGKGIDSDKKSIAFRISLQDTHKTLTDAEAEAAQQRILNVLQEQFQARLRK